MYVNMRVDQPSIQGTKTFEQYFAVRTDMRSEGTLSISEHFKEWEEMGLDMSGKMYEVSLCVEGYNSKGSANIYNHVLAVGDTVYGTPTEFSPEELGNPIVIIIIGLGVVLIGTRAIVVIIRNKNRDC